MIGNISAVTCGAVTDRPSADRPGTTNSPGTDMFSRRSSASGLSTTAAAASDSAAAAGPHVGTTCHHSAPSVPGAT